METAVARTVMVMSLRSDLTETITPDGAMFGEGTETQTPTHTTTLAPGETRNPTATLPTEEATSTDEPYRSPTPPPEATSTSPPPTPTTTSTVPPPPTATQDVCSGLGLSGFSPGGQELSIEVYGGIETVTVKDVLEGALDGRRTRPRRAGHCDNWVLLGHGALLYSQLKIVPVRDPWPAAGQLRSAWLSGTGSCRRGDAAEAHHTLRGRPCWCAARSK